ncbi:MAG: hypothetical protein H6858_09560 [Rhodospirillales bacterium]|nr:hypothetical protein [Alphaproteobacteria bacterium]MCB1840723.1 hypothetical protein [Alphaproteobacteria bacterium]MCB9977832.1 hypothetical protein [Rhodospirillales bacterium]
MSVWELWIERYVEIVDGESVEGEDYSFFPKEDNEDYRTKVRLAGKGAEKVWTVEAADFSDACTKLHKYMGWPDYIPEDNSS